MYKNIPGWLTINDAKILQLLARTVPENGTILELGSFLGRSACCIAEVALKNIKIHCIDSWEDAPEWDSIPDLLRDFSCKKKDIFPTEEKFIKNIQPYKIIRHKKNIKNYKLDVKPDLIFLDAIHNKSYLKSTIKYYFSTLNVNGIFSGHDYSDEFPYKKRCVDEVTKELNKELITFSGTTIWYWL